jgi:hypothetical protein
MGIVAADSASAPQFYEATLSGIFGLYGFEHDDESESSPEARLEALQAEVSQTVGTLPGVQAVKSLSLSDLAEERDGDGQRANFKATLLVPEGVDHDAIIDGVRERCAELDGVSLAGIYSWSF